MTLNDQDHRLRVVRRDFLNYRTECPNCGAPIGPRHSTRELMDIPPDPPYAALVRCSRCGRVTFVEFEAEASSSPDS